LNVHSGRGYTTHTMRFVKQIKSYVLEVVTNCFCPYHWRHVCSISWNVRKVSIGCEKRVHLWQLNNEYTTQTVFYLLIIFRHLFIILIRILNNLIQFVHASCLRMLFYAKW